MIELKRRFGDYFSISRARCEWDTLDFNLNPQKFYEFLDVLKNTLKKSVDTL